MNSSLSDFWQRGNKNFFVRQTLTCRSDTFPSFSQLPKTHWGFPVLLSSLCHFSSGCLSFSLTHTHTHKHTPPPPPWHHSWLPSLRSPPHTPEPPDYHHSPPRETMALSSRLKLWEQKGGAEFRACGSDWASGEISLCVCFAVQPNMHDTIGCALIKPPRIIQMRHYYVCMLLQVKY